MANISTANINITADSSQAQASIIKIEKSLKQIQDKNIKITPQIDTSKIKDININQGAGVQKLPEIKTDTKSAQVELTRFNSSMSDTATKLQAAASASAALTAAGLFDAADKIKGGEIKATISGIFQQISSDIDKLRKKNNETLARPDVQGDQALKLARQQMRLNLAKQQLPVAQSAILTLPNKILGSSQAPQVVTSILQDITKTTKNIKQINVGISNIGKQFEISSSLSGRASLLSKTAFSGQKDSFQVTSKLASSFLPKPLQGASNALKGITTFISGGISAITGPLLAGFALIGGGVKIFNNFKSQRAKGQAFGQSVANSISSLVDSIPIIGPILQELTDFFTGRNSAQQKALNDFQKSDQKFWTNFKKNRKSFLDKQDDLIKNSKTNLDDKSDAFIQFFKYTETVKDQKQKILDERDKRIEQIKNSTIPQKNKQQQIKYAIGRFSQSIISVTDKARQVTISMANDIALSVRKNTAKIETETRSAFTSALLASGGTTKTQSIVQSFLKRQKQFADKFKELDQQQKNLNDAQDKIQQGGVIGFKQSQASGNISDRLKELNKSRQNLANLSKQELANIQQQISDNSQIEKIQRELVKKTIEISGLSMLITNASDSQLQAFNKRAENLKKTQNAQLELNKILQEQTVSGIKKQISDLQQSIFAGSQSGFDVSKLKDQMKLLQDLISKTEQQGNAKRIQIIGETQQKLEDQLRKSKDQQTKILEERVKIQDLQLSEKQDINSKLKDTKIDSSSFSSLTAFAGFTGKQSDLAKQLAEVAKSNEKLDKLIIQQGKNQKLMDDQNKLIIKQTTQIKNIKGATFI